MVSPELQEIYDKLKRKRELYTGATRVGNYIIFLGFVLLFSTVLLIFPKILEIFFGIDMLYSTPLGFLLGIILMAIGLRKNAKTLTPPSLSAEEVVFLKVFDALKDLDMYLREKEVEFLKIEAAKKLSKVERSMYEPSASRRRLWGRLTRVIDENLRLLKRNLKQKLIPIIRNKEKEEIMNVYPIVEELARYFVNPSLSHLADLNKSMVGLSEYVEEKPLAIPFFERYPKLRHVCFVLSFALLSYLMYYVGVELLGTSIENTYLTAVIVWATLTAGYIALLRRK